MTDPGSPAFPVAKDDDDDDVAWALSTAQVQWKRGSQADAVVWLRRAIDSANSVGATWRAADLTRETDALESYLVSGPATSAAPLSIPDLVAADDEGDIISDEALSLPPDADVAEAEEIEAEVEEAEEVEPDVEAEAEEVEAEAEEVEAEAEEVEAEAEEVEAEAEEVDADEDVIDADDEVVEIEADDVDDDVAEDDLAAEPLPRFASEAPTANLVDPGFADDEGETEPGMEPAVESADAESETYIEPETETAAVIETAAETDAAIESETESEVEEDPLPTPVRLSATENILPEPPGEPLVAGISLAEIAGFEDFPPETQVALARVARVERLATDEEVSGFGLALVLRGAINVMPAIADATCGAAGERELVYGRGSLQDGVALRLVATAPDTQIAIWDFETIEPPLADCPWVLEELQAVADRYQALAGVSMGAMGERLDDSLRGMVLSRCKLVRLLPGEVLVEKGKPVGGLFIVGAGRLELGVDAASAGSEGELGPGEFLFAPQILSAGAAPTAARAGAAGALLMAADRHAAHELMLSVPPLLEILAG